MTDRPILFSAPMVRALLAGTKTQTRRLIKPQPAMTASGRWKWEGKTPGAEASCFFGDDEFMSRALLDEAVRYAVGDRLWVREAWWAEARYDDRPPRDIPTTAPIYYQTEPEPGCAGRYRHGRFMVRWMSRLTLTVTDVRVQRLQDISNEDCIAEGIPMHFDENVPRVGHAIDDFARNHGLISHYGAEYRRLWDSINAGRAPWDSNPWVCAITFKTALGNIDAISEAA